MNNLPEGWKPELTDDVMFLLTLLLAQAGIAVGSEPGIYVVDVSVTVQGLWIALSDGHIVKLRSSFYG